MKATAIPAQITTVEDRIAGNLNLTQLLLLSVPLFLTAVIFFLFPPLGRFCLYKIIVAGIITSACALLALRTGEKTMLDLLRVRAGYEFRPHIYIYQKAKTTADLPKPEKKDPSSLKVRPRRQTSFNLSASERRESQKLLGNRKYAVSFESRSGGLIVKVNVAS